MWQKLNSFKTIYDLNILEVLIVLVYTAYTYILVVCRVQRERCFPSLIRGLLASEGFARGFSSDIRPSHTENWDSGFSLLRVLVKAESIQNSIIKRLLGSHKLALHSFLSIYLPIYLSIYLSIYLKIYLSVHLYIYNLCMYFVQYILHISVNTPMYVYI